MKIFAGIVLLVIGLGIGYAVYSWAAGGAQSQLALYVTLDGQTSISKNLGIPASGENETTVDVLVKTYTGYSQNVTLDATGEPSGVLTSFSPSSGTPEFGSTLTVRVNSTAISGATTITVKATGADATEKSATLNLTLENTSA